MPIDPPNEIASESQKAALYVSPRGSATDVPDGVLEIHRGIELAGDRLVKDVHERTAVGVGERVVVAGCVLGPLRGHGVEVVAVAEPVLGQGGIAGPALNDLDCHW
jgi:hypothetical protein